MQTILGSGGAIGNELAKSLLGFTQNIRLVSRNPKKVTGHETLFPADLTDRNQLFKAVEGSDICYLTIGLEYKTKVWQKQWPELIKNVVEACIQHQAKLVFFDNVYALGAQSIPSMTELSPMNPCSKKGEVRAQLDQFILDHIQKKGLQAIIARAPDFFGPDKKTSMMMNLVYDNLKKGKKAQWLCNTDKVHSMGYVPDLAKGTAILGNTPDAYNQIWNLPTSSEKTTGKMWITYFAELMKGSTQAQVLPPWGIKLIGLFIPIVGEIYEMRYQNDRDYFFDSSKFCQKFSFTPTTNRAAVRETVAALAESAQSA